VKRREVRLFRNRAAGGYGPAEIAREFGRDARTVKTYLGLPGSGELMETKEVRETLPLHYRDPELGPHQREMFYVSARVRDRIHLPEGVSLVETLIGRSRLFWRGEDSSSPWYWAVDTEEVTIARDWGHDLTDAHGHPLFPLFEQHLEGKPSLRLLEDAETAIELCATAYQKLGTFISRRLISELPDLRPDDLQGMAFSLIMDAQHRLASHEGYKFSYKPVRTSPFGIEGLPPAWHLELGFWRIGDVDNPEALTRVAQVHKLLIEAISRWASYDWVKKTSGKAQEAIQEFQRTLSPDARLRKLLFSSRCSECP
jgi:hypothetical protein